MTQQDLATLAGVSRATICLLEGGQCEHLQVRTMMSIAMALGISGDQMLGIDKPLDVRQGIRREMFPLIATGGPLEIQKCFACDSLLSMISHTEAACIMANHERGKCPEWLASFYGVELEWIFRCLVAEQRRIAAERR